MTTDNRPLNSLGTDSQKLVDFCFDKKVLENLIRTWQVRRAIMGLPDVPVEVLLEGASDFNTGTTHTIPD